MPGQAFAKVELRVLGHRKEVGLSDEAMGLWTRCVLHAKQQRTGGFVAYEFVAYGSVSVEARLERAAELVRRGWLEPAVETDWRPEDGWRMHDWDDAQNDGDYEAIVEKRREAGRIGGLRSGEVRASKQGSKPEALASEARKQTRSKTNLDTDTDTESVSVPSVPHPAALETAGDVGRVWEAYRASTGRNGNYAFTAKRKRLIVGALKLYPPDDVIAAVEGWRDVPWNAGENRDRRVFNDLELLLRDAEHIERFRDAHRGLAAVGIGGGKVGRLLAMSRRLAEEGR